MDSNARTFGTIAEVEAREAAKLAATLRRVQEAHQPQQPTMPPELRHHIEQQARRRMRAELRQVLEAPLVPAHGPRPLSVVDLSNDRPPTPRRAPADRLPSRAPVDDDDLTENASGSWK